MIIPVVVCKLIETSSNLYRFYSDFIKHFIVNSAFKDFFSYIKHCQYTKKALR